MKKNIEGTTEAKSILIELGVKFNDENKIDVDSYLENVIIPVQRSIWNSMRFLDEKEFVQEENYGNISVYNALAIDGIETYETPETILRGPIFDIIRDSASIRRMLTARLQNIEEGLNNDLISDTFVDGLRTIVHMMH